MTDNVVRLQPITVGEDYRFEADVILEEAKGQNIRDLLVIGMTEEGEIWVSGTANAGQSLILIEQAKHHIVFGGDD